MCESIKTYELCDPLIRYGGVYVLFMKLLDDVVLMLNTKELIIESGFYCYVGSALGPGGILSRLKHHLNKRKKRLWWHIDYLTSNDNVILTNVVYARVSTNVEEAIASKLMELKCFKPTIKGFGSSDKKSYTHLFKCVCSEDKCIEEVENIFKLFIGSCLRLALDDIVN